MLARLQARPERLVWLAGVLLVLIWLLVYLTTVSPTVNFIDSGELITAVHEPGIAHPPGYPLYVLMGYVASHILWGDIAWRVNVLSAFWGAMAVGAFYFLIYRCSLFVLALKTPRAQNTSKASQRMPATPREGKRRGSTALMSGATPQAAQHTEVPHLLLIAASVAGASLLAASSTFWSRTAQAKMYTLHFFFIALLFTLAVQYRTAYDRGDKTASNRWLIALVITLGISFTNHLMTVLLVLPIALLLVGGDDMMMRARVILRKWVYLVPAFVVPLLLYAYLPLRSSSDPLMNWGTPDTLGDFWRHITGWQYHVYLGGNIGQNIGLLARYTMEQWGLLTIPVYLGAIAAAVLLFRARSVLFWPTLLMLLLTIAFALLYGISEIEPYMVGAYTMLIVWIGLAPACWIALTRDRDTSPSRIQTGRRSEAAAASTIETSKSETQQQAWAITVLAAVVALGSAIMIYPKQNYSQNRLAEQFVQNVFDELPQNSIVFTDYWDFYAPTYYLQVLQGLRPDLTLIDKSLLRYPWYTEQLTKRYPALMQKSQDVVNIYAPEQQKFVNGTLTDADTNIIDSSYYDLMTSFVERNTDRPAYMLTISPCPPDTATQKCDDNRIAPTYSRVPAGLEFKLVSPDSTDFQVPAEPDYKTDGITTNQVGLDDAARTNSLFYVEAYRRMSAYFSALNQTVSAQHMADRANALLTAIGNR